MKVDYAEKTESKSLPEVSVIREIIVTAIMAISFAYILFLAV